MPSKYSIKDLERLSGIKAHTLRIWELRYDILNPERTGTNIRYYSNTDLKRILNVSLLNNNGYKISNIAKLSNEELLGEVDKFLNGNVKESNQIENLVLCLMDMDEARFEKTVNTSIHNFGFESTIEKIIFPFMRHMGNMWQLGIISPAQEHYISNLVRQKIIAGIDKLEQKNIAGAQKIIFFLPHNEMHEMGLLYAYYIAKSKGHKCLYLGQSVPLEDLKTISKTVGPDLMVSIFTANVPDLDITSFLSECNAHIPACRFLISGRMLMDVSENFKMPAPRFKVFENFQNFREQLETPEN